MTPEDLAGRSDLLDDGSHYRQALSEARHRELDMLRTIDRRRRGPEPWSPEPRPRWAYRSGGARRPRPAPAPLPEPIPAPTEPAWCFPSAGPITRRPVDHDALRRAAASATQVR